jgi:glycosyltransferase involved in cell wall biosynthesis
MGQNIGGPALSRTLSSYVKAGWNVFFITGNGSDSNQKLSGIDIVRFDLPWLKQWFSIRGGIGAIARTVWWFYFQITAFGLAVRLHRQVPFAVVYGYEIMGVPVAKALSTLWRIPVVSRFQGTTFQVSWSNNNWIKFLRAWDHWFALRTPTDLIIMTDDGTQGDQVLHQLGADMNKVRFWMNGTDKEEYAALPSKENARAHLGLKHRNVILMVSRLVGWKCVDRAIKAMPTLLEEIPDCLLIIVGDGEERVKLGELAKNLKVDDHILFVGSVPHQDIKQFLAAADIFLSLYTWSNVGNPLLEAMLAGKCIVTLANGDTPKIIKHNVTGILLEEDNLLPLPDTLFSLLRDPITIATIGENARQYAMENFPTWEQRLFREINEVLNLSTLYSQSAHPEEGKISR